MGCHSQQQKRRPFVTNISITEAKIMSNLRKFCFSPTARQARLQVHRRNLMQGPRPRVLLQPQQQRARHEVLSKRDIHFLPLLGLWGAKHVSMWTLYNTAKAYGWHRVYRRLLEQNRAMFANQQRGTKVAGTQQKQMQALIRLAIRSPPQLARQLTEKANVVLPYLQQLAEKAEPAVPRFLVVAAKVILNSTKPIKILQDVLSAVPASTAKKIPK